MTSEGLELESRSILVAENRDKPEEYLVSIPKAWIDTGDDETITITTAKSPKIKFVILHDAESLDEENAVLEAINSWIELAKDEHAQKARYEQIRRRFENKWDKW